MKQDTKAPATQKEVLQQGFDDAEHVYNESVQEVTRLDAQAKAERTAIEKLEGDYTAACRTMASGGNANTPSILAEKDRRGDRLRGLESLSKEATERLEPLREAMHAAERALQREIDRLERERLQAAVPAAIQEKKRAEAALQAAQQAENTARWSLGQFESKHAGL